MKIIVSLQINFTEVMPQCLISQLARIFVQKMTWRRREDKSLSEPMMAYLGDTYMRPLASITLR